MEVDGKGSPWRHCRLVTSRHATWSCLLSVGNALSTANLFKLFSSRYLTSECRISFDFSLVGDPLERVGSKDTVVPLFHLLEQ